MRPIRLATEYLHDPLGIDARPPRLSWQLPPSRRRLMQTAYQVRAAGSMAALRAQQPDLWDSGEVAGSRQHLVEYGGPALQARQRVHWQVQVRDERGALSAWSAPAVFEMGLLRNSDWRADWIGADWVGGPRTLSPAANVRRGFRLPAGARKARLYITAMGVFDAFVNGARVGRDVFAPGWTNYHKRVQVMTYDVTALLRAGNNVLAARLGDGWAVGHTSWEHRQMYCDRPRLLAQLEIELADGATHVIATDQDWRVAPGGILESDMLMGESVDARLEPRGWLVPGFNDGAWRTAQVFADNGAARVSFFGEPVRPMEQLPPVAPPGAVPNHAASRYIIDLGQNFAGRVRLKARAPRGTTITLRYGEMLNPNGTLYTANLRSARATDHFTFAGNGLETYESAFTFHGFRYVEVTGLPKPPKRADVTGVALYNDMTPTGSFECSDPLLNQLQKNIVWGQKGNYLDLPTDCPQRDERLGWTGDTQMFARAGAFNFNVAPFLTRWLRTLVDDQAANGAYPAVSPNANPRFVPDGGPAWADAGVIVPWTLWKCYGDTRVLSDNYAAMCRFMDYLERSSTGLIRCHPQGARFHGFDDWLNMNAPTPRDLIGTAFFAHSAACMQEIAAVLGRRGDAARFGRLHGRICAAFCARFVDAVGDLTVDTQTAYVLALHFGLLSQALRPRAANALVRNIRARDTHLSTGFVGTPYLAHVLAAHDRLDVAYALLQQTSCPSWLYPVTQGATTIWERWDSFHHEKGFGDVGMNSFNHYAYGAIGAFLYQVVAGINLEMSADGFALRLQPRPGGTLTWARAAYQSPHGEIVSHWSITGRRFAWRVTVPPNISARAVLPDGRERTLGPGKHVLGCKV